MEHSEEILNVKCLEYSSPSWARLVHEQKIKRSNVRRQKYVSMLIQFYVGHMNDSPGAIERWKSQVEGLRLYSSYQDAVGIDGEAIEFEWKKSPGFSSLSILQEIQKDLERKNIQSEEFKDQIIFMSMFNDVEWKRNDETCVSSAEKVKNCPMKFSQGHWTFFGPGSEEKWYGNSSHAQKKEQWNCTADKKVQRSKETGHPVFKGTCAFESCDPEAEER